MYFVKVKKYRKGDNGTVISGYQEYNKNTFHWNPSDRLIVYTGGQSSGFTPLHNQSQKISHPYSTKNIKNHQNIIKLVKIELIQFKVNNNKLNL